MEEIARMRMLSWFQRSLATSLIMSIMLPSIFVLAPVAVHAQNTNPAAATATSDASSTPAKPTGGCVIRTNAVGIPSISDGFTCALSYMLAGLLSSIVSVANGLFTLAGQLFDATVDFTIVSFGSWYQNHVKQAIESAWTTFRDLANILIIGMFVFIAINIILETQEFGRKQLVIRVIVIALLINFSLLFTKLVIDTSNLFAITFYNASLPQNANADPNNTNKPTLAHSFEAALGVTSLGATYNAIQSNLFSNTWDRFGKLIMATLFSVVIYLVGAFVFLYGAFLLLSRAVMIIFLLFISSVAFASYLVPATQRRVLDPWVSALVNVFVMAPLMMLSLWATLLITRELPTATKIGYLFSNPADADAITSLLSYLIVLGLLFGSFLATKKFSSAASGGALRAIVGTVTAVGGGFAARNTIGRFGAWGRSKLEGSAQAKVGEAAKIRSSTLSNSMSGKDDKFLAAQKKLAANLEKKAVGRQLMADRIGRLAGAKFGGNRSFASALDDRAKAAETLAKKLKPSEEDAKKLREEAAKSALDTHKESLETTKQATEELMKTVQQAAAGSTEHINTQTVKKIEEENLREMEKEQQDKETAHQQNLTKLREEAAKAAAEGKEDVVTDMRKKMAEEEVAHETARKEEAAKIEKAREKVANLERRYQDAKVTVPVTQPDGTTVQTNISLKEAADKLSEAAKKVENAESSPEAKRLQAAARVSADKASAATMQQIGEVAGTRSGTITERTVGFFMGDNSAVGKEVAKKYKWKEETDKGKLRKLMKSIEEEDESRPSEQAAPKTDIKKV